MDQLQCLFKRYTSWDTWRPFLAEAFATGLFFFAAQAGNDANPIRWGLTYVAVSEITGRQMLSTLCLRDFAVAAEYSLDSFHNLFFSLFGQAFGAWLGFLFTDYFNAGGNFLDHASDNSGLAVSGDKLLFSLTDWSNLWLEFFAIFLFIFLSTKNASADCSSFWMFLTVAAVFWFKADAVFTPNRYFGQGMGWEFNSLRTYFNWIDAWQVYLVTFVSAYGSHYLQKYCF
jgi:hypothetical protein